MHTLKNSWSGQEYKGINSQWFRRTYTEAGGLRDEAFTLDLVWRSSSSLVSPERGDLENDFIEITEKEAGQLMEQLRARWTGAGQG